MSIFLPSAGRREGTTLVNVRSLGYYWSSSLGDKSVSFARSLIFNSGDVAVSSALRDYGLSLRPVSE